MLARDANSSVKRKILKIRMMGMSEAIGIARKITVKWGAGKSAIHGMGISKSGWGPIGGGKNSVVNASIT